MFRTAERRKSWSSKPGRPGNDDFGARYYSNRFGRWLSADWSAIPVPVPYANLMNPQTLNLYAMVADDPESFADLDGHKPCEVDGEKHGTAWCWAHSKGFVETKKKKAAREKREADEKAAAWKYALSHPEFMFQVQFAVVNVLTAGVLATTDLPSGESSGSVTSQETTAIADQPTLGCSLTTARGSLSSRSRTNFRVPKPIDLRLILHLFID